MRAPIDWITEYLDTNGAVWWKDIRNGCVVAVLPQEAELVEVTNPKKAFIYWLRLDNFEQVENLTEGSTRLFALGGQRVDYSPKNEVRRFSPEGLKGYYPIAEEAARRFNLGGLEVEGVEDGVLLTAPTTNRSDLLSMRGLARDLSALGLGAFKDNTPRLSDLPLTGDAAGLKIELEDAACPLYLGCVVTGVAVTQSPEWLKNKLEQAGQRSINTLVDLTNWACLALGQPMHAFDLQKLGAKTIVVRRAQAGETLETLDHQQRSLTASDLIIATPGGPVALAGVMGGANTEVDETTTAVVLESAWFAPAAVRATAKAHGLRTEASVRFEKSADPAAAQQAMALCLSLIQQLNPNAVFHAVVQAGAPPPRAAAVSLRLGTLTRLLGISPAEGAVRTHLANLGFELEKKPDGFNATPPSWRHDIELEADLVEEIARLEGFDTLPAQAPVLPLVKGQLGAARQLQRKLAGLLWGMGFQEALTFSMVDAPQASVSFGGGPALAIANPLTAEVTHLRRSLLPSLLKVARHNLHHRRGEVALFEIGKVFHGTAADTQENLVLGLLLCGARPKHLRPDAAPSGDFYALKGEVEALLLRLGLGSVTFTPAETPALNRLRSARLLVGQQPLGFIGEVHPVLLHELDVPEETVAYCELDLQALHLALPPPPVRYQPVNLLPAVVRDLAVLVEESVSVGALLAEARHAGGQPLTEAWVFDLYRGAGVPEGHKSVALSLKLEDPASPLTEQAAAAVVEAVAQALASRFGAVRR